MFTRCPHCQTRFRVSAAQLKAGRGQVRCGRCQEVFDALDYLAADEPEAPAAKQQLDLLQGQTASSPPPQSPPADNTPKQNKKPAQTAPAKQSRTARPPAQQDRPANPPHTHPATQPATPQQAPRVETGKPEPDQAPPPLVEPAADVVTPPVPPEVAEPDPVMAEPTAESDTAISVEETRTAEVATQPAADALAQDADTERPLPFQLQPEPARHRPGQLGWTLASLVLIALLAGQYVYARRLEMVNYPLLRPWLEQACQLTGCSLPTRRSPAQILMLDNTVQTHPRIPGALLITATLINKAGFAQPLPVLEVDMLSVDQKVVARRRFLPRQYLADGDLRALLEPETEAHVQLEVADPGPSAVGFRFDIL